MTKKLQTIEAFIAPLKIYLKVRIICELISVLYHNKIDG